MSFSLSVRILGIDSVVFALFPLPQPEWQASKISNYFHGIQVKIAITISKNHDMLTAGREGFVDFCH